MTYKRILLPIAMSILAIAIFGFKKHKDEVKENNTAEEVYTWKNLIRKYQRISEAKEREKPTIYISGNYGMFGLNEHSIKLTKVQTAQKLSDLLVNYPDIKDRDIESVWVKSMFGEKETSVMARSNKLSTEQKELLYQAKQGDFFDIVVNYTVKEDNGSIAHERINKGLTVVPEIEAAFLDGQDALIAYFAQNKNLMKTSKDISDFSNVRIKFIISEQGSVEDVELERASNYREIDEILVNLVKTMPAWTPAVNEDGKKVKQWFRLLYGRPGC